LENDVGLGVVERVTGHGVDRVRVRNRHGEVP